MQSIDQNGWPNVTSASGQSFGGGVRFPKSSDFAGPYVITWDGDGKFALLSGTWTEASTTSTAVGNANGTTTLSGFSSVVGIAPGFGITGTGVPGSTTVVSVNYSAKSIVVSASVTAGSGITFTFTNGTYTKNANGNWSNTTGVKPYIVVSNSGLSTPTLSSQQFQLTGSAAVSVSSISWNSGVATVTTASPHNRPLGQTVSLTFFGATPGSINATFLCTATGASTYTFPLVNNPGAISGTITYVAFLTNAAIYRQADEVDFMPTSLGGNQRIFRTAYKQNFVNMQPAAIRFLNWIDAIASQQIRWEYRSIPTKAGTSLNATAGPAYGDTSGVNQYTLAAATGTAGNTQTTPASMVHGEVVTCRIGVGGTGVRAKSTPTAITQANPGNVTTSSAHGYSNGDLVIFLSANTNNIVIGMKELDRVVFTVANATATTFDIQDINGNPINTTSFTAFAATGNKANSTIYPYMSLQVGSGNDRIAYGINESAVAGLPISGTGSGPAILTATWTNSFVFDKNLAARRTHGTSPNWVMGCWTAVASGANANYYSGDIPVEYCAAFVAEVNILALAQGISKPIHMYLSTPPRSLLPGDPDYSSASDWVVNAVNTVFEGGYGCAGLNQTQASLILEWSNETWNFGSVNNNYLTWLGYIRGAGSTADIVQLPGLRMAMCARDVSNSRYPSKVFKTIGLQTAHNWDSQNQGVALGNGIYFTDPWNTWGSATPLSFNDAVNVNTYIDPNSTYTSTTTGTGTFTDDSAMYNGTDNSANSGGNYTGAANTSQALANFVAACTTTGSNAINTVFGQVNTIATNVSPKTIIGYEGSTDWVTASGGSINGNHTITAADNTFLLTTNQSSQFATAYFGFLSNVAALSNAGPFPIYLTQSQNGATADFRWSYFGPDTYSGGVEGAAWNNSPMLSGLATRNSSLA
jgi:hypothetical protein